MPNTKKRDVRTQNRTSRSFLVQHSVERHGTKKLAGGVAVVAGGVCRSHGLTEIRCEDLDFVSHAAMVCRGVSINTAR
jgi:hypothetical protein